MADGDILGPDKSLAEAWYLALSHCAKIMGCSLSHGDENPNELYLESVGEKPNSILDKHESRSNYDFYFNRITQFISSLTNENGNFIKGGPEIGLRIIGDARLVDKRINLKELMQAMSISNFDDILPL